jgi:hypothetical protein
MFAKGINELALIWTNIMQIDLTEAHRNIVLEPCEERTVRETRGSQSSALCLPATSRSPWSRRDASARIVPSRARMTAFPTSADPLNHFASLGTPVTVGCGRVSVDLVYLKNGSIIMRVKRRQDTSEELARKVWFTIRSLR